MRPDHFANPRHQSDDEPNQAGWSSEPRIELRAERNINMNGEQNVGNVTGSSLPLRGNFLVKADNNVNKGKLQDVGNVAFCNIKPKKMNDTTSSSESNYAHRNHSPSTDPPAAQDPGQGESSRQTINQEIKDNKSSKGMQEFGNIKLKKKSAIAFFNGGGGVSQSIVGNSNGGKVQRIGNIESKDDADHDAR